jgi:hypothetical protein
VSELTTAAGRALIAKIPLTSDTANWATNARRIWTEEILAIEAEAAAPYREALERLVDELRLAPDIGLTATSDAAQRYLEARALLRREVGDNEPGLPGSSEHLEPATTDGTPLLLDNDQAVERLRVVVHRWMCVLEHNEDWIGEPRCQTAARVTITALREGGQHG